MLGIALTITLALVVAPFPGAQQSSAPGSLPRIRLNVPQEIPAESIVIEYFLEGPFGGYGQVIRPKTGQRAFDIAAGVDTQPAVNVKVIAYLPACQYVRLDLPIEDRTTTKDLRCSPLGTRRLRGKILGPIIDGPLAIDVTYDPLWSHGFFGIADGMTATVHVARVTIARGEFTVDLPDLVSEGVGFFDFTLIDLSTGRASTLTPVQNGKTADPLRAQASYEAPVEFAVEPPPGVP